jgi:hypothetical protein
VPRLTAQKNANNVPKLVADITLTLSHHKKAGKLKGRVCADNNSRKVKRLVKNNRHKNDLSGHGCIMKRETFNPQKLF